MPRHLPLLLALGAAASTGNAVANAPGATAAVAYLPVATALLQTGSGGFGAVIDSRRTGAAGRTVLAVTPGDTAARMGLRPGDVIVSINGTDLDARDNVTSRLRSADPGAGLSLGIVREGRPLTLSTNHDRGMAPPGTPAIRGCGYFSGDDAPPRNTRSIYPVEILNIDGASTPAMFTPNRYRVDAGRHVLVLRERIDDHRFTPLLLKERRRLLAHDRARAYKVLIVDVDPDTRHSVGAKLKDPNAGIGAIRDNSYWEPVVWQHTSDPCTTAQQPPAPAVSTTGAACAFVTAHGVPAGQEQRVFPVAITAIDGLDNYRANADIASPGAARMGMHPTGGSRYHRLEPGEHTLTLRARADLLDVSSADRRLLEHHQRSAIVARADHSLTLHADPSRAYWVGGRLLDVPIDGKTVRTGSWWEPVLIEKPEDIACP